MYAGAAASDFKEHVVAKQIRPLRRVHIREIESVEHFYRAFGYEPVIVQGVFSDNPFLRDIDLESLERSFRGQQFGGYNPQTEEHMYMDCEQVFADFRAGVRRINVVDHSVRGTEFGSRFSVPFFLADNWYVGSGFGTDGYERSIIISAANSFTPLHYDANGMQGWMYLLMGEKHWVLYQPEEAERCLYNTQTGAFFHPMRSAPEAFPLRGETTRYSGVQHAGELVYFPPGWVHQVHTPAAGIGIGGSVFNGHRLGDSLRSWLREVRQGTASALDVTGLVLNRLARMSQTDRAEAERLHTELVQVCADAVLPPHATPVPAELPPV